MAVLQIWLFPDPILRKHSKFADWRDPQVLQFIKHMTDTLYAQKNGIGIAAPQVGFDKRVVVMDVSPRDPSHHREVMVNPTILRTEGVTPTREGCMSLPDYTGSLKRHERVLAQWTTTTGRRLKKWLVGIEAICLQHEIDHLNGILFIDRVPCLKSDILPRRVQRKS